MQRRDLLKFAALTATATAAQRAMSSSLLQTTAPNPGIRRVLVAFKCHLDVGFTDTQAAVMRKYFDVYYPQAIATAAALRKSGSDRYIWTRPSSVAPWSRPSLPVTSPGTRSPSVGRPRCSTAR
jgi:hypothetical protein